MSRFAKALYLLACSSSALAIQESLRIVGPHKGLDQLIIPAVGHKVVRPAALHATFNERIKQVLLNHQDTLYTGTIDMGGETIEGILDTGSFELVVFGKHCMTCGTAVAYDHDKSSNYSAGTNMKQLSYGSGSCNTRDGYDAVSCGGLKAEKQAFWETMNCRMPLLANAEFNAIVGVGPPGEAVYEAEHLVAQYEDMLSEDARPLFGWTKGMLENGLRRAKETLVLAKTKPDLIEQFKVNRFSACFGRVPGSVGYMIWNDENREHSAGVVSVDVPGDVTWSVKIQGASFVKSGGGEEKMIGCHTMGCGAIVDTGTTLIGVDTDTYQAAFDYIAGLQTDCSDMSKFPNLIFDLGDGKKLTLPPDSYISEVYGLVSDDLNRLWRRNESSPFEDKRPMSFRTTERGQVVMCQLMFMDMGTVMTSAGYQMILGMAVFREYYTTFDLGTGRGTRKMQFSPANEQCEPVSEQELNSGSFRKSSDLPTRPRRVDASKIVVPSSRAAF